MRFAGSSRSIASLPGMRVSFCTRRHFGRPQAGETEQYIRLAYSGISAEDIRDGLGKLRDWKTV